MGAVIFLRSKLNEAFGTATVVYGAMSGTMGLLPRSRCQARF